MNRELTVTLTECTVFIFTLRTLVRQPLQIKLNESLYWPVCAEIMLWQIDDNDEKKEKVTIYTVSQITQSTVKSCNCNALLQDNLRKQFIKHTNNLIK